ncbi:MAG: signal recognition particle-docking protein FtsY [Spirochaetales bacterium]|jgi:fused signal recognition particle receptor|nr:signal recognition particle-docking protein FtsY [Spirochaetales bacterium]
MGFKFGIGAKLKALFSGFRKTLDQSFFDNLEDLLIEGDFGARNAMMISDEVNARKPKTEEEFLSIVRELLEDKINGTELLPDRNELNVYLVLGVNGVGKTTSIAKLATYYKDKGYKVVMAAGDTFRAAAIDQLELHAQRTGTRIVRQENGSDPGAVIYDAISSAQARGDNLILCDTAGRMHNKENLVRELQKIDKVIRNRIKPENYKKILVIDATTGQNSISQAQIFNEAVGIDALILTKYDSAAKAGALVQIGIPVAFIGTGEHYDDIHVFDKEEFLTTLAGLGE